MQITPAETGWSGLSGIVTTELTLENFRICERDGDILCDRDTNTITTRAPPFALIRLIESFIGPDGIVHEPAKGYFSPRLFGEYNSPDGRLYDRPNKDDNKTQGSI